LCVSILEFTFTFEFLHVSMATSMRQHGLNSHLLITGSLATYEGVSMTGAMVKFCEYNTNEPEESLCVKAEVKN